MNNLIRLIAYLIWLIPYLLIAFGVWLIIDGVYSIIRYHDQPFWPDQTIRIIRAIIGACLIIFGLILIGVGLS